MRRCLLELPSATDSYMSYRPLPDGLVIAKSRVHGYGLHTTIALGRGTYLGIVRHEIDDKIIRTPLGGHLNHSETPNCAVVKYGDGMYHLVTLEPIRTGRWEQFTSPRTELTTKYVLPEYDNEPWT